MRKHRILPFLFALLLVSCQDGTTPSSLGSTGTVPSTSLDPATASLVVTGYPTLIYDQYESLDLSGMEVTLKTEDGEQKVTGYQLVGMDGTAYEDGDILKEEGSFSLKATYEGLETSRFVLSVLPVTDYSETLLVSSAETDFEKGSTFDPSLLDVQRSFSYTDVDGKKQSRKESVLSYDATIDGEAADGFVFADYGAYRVHVECEGGLETLEGETTLHVLQPPKTYEDDGIFVSTDGSTMTVHITNDGKDSNVDPLGVDEENKGYYDKDDVELAYTMDDYAEDNVFSWKYAKAHPKEGETTRKLPLLVVPVIVPGYESQATPGLLDTIEEAFFGKSEDMAYESLRSYFLGSSKGQLEFTGLVTDYFDARTESSFFKNENAINDSNFPTLAQECADFAYEKCGVDLDSFDSDDDGLIDCMWLVWIGKMPSSATGIYWPFSTTAQNQADPDREIPLVNNIGWVGDYFLSGYSRQNPVDGHVLIHETSHMLGLIDYYSYDPADYSPVGYRDMMSNNVGDHNPYSKMLLGWITPIVVYGNDVTITIDTSVASDDVIVLPYDKKTYEVDEETGKVLFNPFDEYLILDFYSPEGKLAGSSYDLYPLDPITEKGGRLYHVDARLMETDMSTITATFPDDPDAIFQGGKKHYLRAIDNSQRTSYPDTFHFSSTIDLYDEIRWISADRRYLSEYDVADEGSLFYEGDSFSLEDYEDQFVFGRLDSGYDFGYSFSITDIALSDAR